MNFKPKAGTPNFKVINTNYFSKKPTPKADCAGSSKRDDRFEKQEEEKEEGKEEEKEEEEEEEEEEKEEKKRNGSEVIKRRK